MHGRYWMLWWLLLAPAAQAQSFGPPVWTQYRLRPSHNAVWVTPGAPVLPNAHYATSAAVVANPVVVGDRLYVGNHMTGGLFAFAVRTARVLWDNDSPWFRHAPNWVHADMLLVHGRLYVGYGNRVFRSAQVRGTGRSGVRALNPETGATLWDHPTLGEVMPTPAYWQGSLYVATGGGALLALDPRTGHTQWHMRLPGWDSMSSPAVRDGHLYVGAENALVAVDLRRHRALWVYHDNATFTDVPPAVSRHDHTVVITGMKARSNASLAERKRYPLAKGYLQFIYAFDARTGALRWKHLMGNGPRQNNNTAGTPTLADGRVYVGSPYTHSLFCYRLDDGKLLWKAPVAAKVKGGPAVVGGRVYFGDTSGFLHVLNAGTGDPLRNAHGAALRPLKLGGSLGGRTPALAPGGPVIINQDVFIGSRDGNVYRVSIPQWIGAYH
ncbi:MAG TPA: PQQ-binding-like beta-propeller repeat protein [Acidiferrobacteraceae bacterium]|nr:PQQ-binding-like beta-propeller repeat protein [Acidiferrobacteraceae bacterium]